MKSKENIEYLYSLYNKLSEPIVCGMIDSKGIRRQKSGGEWSKERIFILSDDIHKDKPSVIYRSYFGDTESWKHAIGLYLKSERAFKHPIATMYCLTEDSITSRQLSFDLDLIDFKL